MAIVIIRQLQNHNHLGNVIIVISNLNGKYNETQLTIVKT